MVRACGYRLVTILPTGSPSRRVSSAASLVAPNTPSVPRTRGAASPTPSVLQERLDNLEQTVADLAREVRALRSVVDRLEQKPSTPAAPVVPDVPRSERSVVAPDILQPRRPDPRIDPEIESERREAQRRTAERRATVGSRSIDFESLIGRYGTLALASLTILLGAGAFLSWAIANGKIGPELRVLLGALGAAAVAVVARRLRARGSMRFGSTLLALALALVHVDAWGAGPYLKLVPSPVALGVAAAASIALAVLAWVNDEEALFSVGVGGALIAPFVTSGDAGSVPALLAYGYVVLACGLVALRGRTWRTSVAVATIGCWLYTASSAAAVSRGAPTLERDSPALFAVAIAWSALALTRGRWGARIAQSALAALFGVLLSEMIDRAPAADLVMLAALGTLTAYAAVQAAATSAAAPDEPGKWKQPLFAAAVLPLALGFVALGGVSGSIPRALVALGWTAAAVAAAYVQPAARPTHLMVAGIGSGVALLFAFERKAVASCIALAAHATALSLLLRRERTRLLGVPIALGLTVLTIWTFNQLGERPLYGYAPFLTAPSLAALAMSVAWLIVSWNASRVELVDGGYGTLETRTAVRLAGGVVAFMWGNTELARAYSADVSTFLLILYYAVVGVAAIFTGRARAIRVLRHVGLGLAIFAALKAIAEASSLDIGLRVGSYFLAGLFLLAVAYWYRERDTDKAEKSVVADER